MTLPRLALLGLLALAACYRVPGRPIDLPGEASTDALPVEHLRVLVWNIKKTKRRAFPLEWFDYVGDRHLVLVQEVFVQEAPSPMRMIEAVQWRGDMQWHVGESLDYRLREGEPGTGVAIGSVAPSIGEPRVFLTRAREPIFRTPKAALAARYRLEGRSDTLLVISFHGINFRGTRQLEKQLASLRSTIDQHRGPVILGGDFNTHNRSRMKALEHFRKQTGMEALWPTCWVRGRRQCTNPYFKDRKSFLGWPLDHVLVRGLASQGFHTVPDAKGSDHIPLMVELRVE